MKPTDPALLSAVQSSLTAISHPYSTQLALEILDHLNNDLTSLPMLIAQLASGTPWEHIYGKTTFCGLTLTVTPDTLIPREETEQLIDLTDVHLKSLPSIPNAITIHDVGTGSGAIILAALSRVVSHLPLSKVAAYGYDISQPALEIATTNAHRNSLPVTFILSDLLTNYPHPQPDSHNILLANLPYIPTTTYHNLDRSVRDFEPKLALEAGDDGLREYRRLFEQLSQLSYPFEYMAFEIDPEIEPAFDSLISTINPPQPYSYKKHLDIANRIRFATFSKA